MPFSTIYFNSQLIIYISETNKYGGDTIHVPIFAWYKKVHISWSIDGNYTFFDVFTEQLILVLEKTSLNLEITLWK